MNKRFENGNFESIDELYAFVSIQSYDGEGIMAFSAPGSGMMMPMIGADLGRVESLKPIADSISKLTGVKYEIRHFVRSDKKL